MGRRRWRYGIRIAFPAKEGAEAEVLDDGEFGENFCVVHFDHALGKASVEEVR
jgi:hypothetical protein